MKLEPLLYVSDLSRSIQFYRDLLGLRIGVLFPNEKDPTYAPVFIGESKLMLCLARDSNWQLHKDGLGGSGLQLFIQVENVDELFDRIEERVNVVESIETKPWGDREFSFSDPDNYLITFYTPLVNLAKV